MILIPYNSTNPLFWGKDLRFVVNGQIVEPNQIKSDFPREFNFFNLWAGKDPINAKLYYERMHLL